MNEKIKKLVKFIVVDTAYWIITLTAIILTVTTIATYLFWSWSPFNFLLSIGALASRIVVVLSLILACLGGATNNFRY